MGSKGAIGAEGVEDDEGAEGAVGFEGAEEDEGVEGFEGAIGADWAMGAEEVHADALPFQVQECYVVDDVS